MEIDSLENRHDYPVTSEIDEDSSQSMDDLYRKEVAQARRDAWLGTIQVATPLSQRIQGCLALIGLVILVLLAYFGRYTHRETVTGQVVPSHGIVSIASPFSGRVIKVLVDAGSRVRQGDPLIRLSGDQATSELTGGMAYVSSQYASQISKLRDEIASVSLESEEKERALNEKSALLLAQVSRIAEQEAAQKKSARSTRELFIRMRPLASKGYISAVQMQQQEIATYEAEGQYSALVRQRIDLIAQSNGARSDARQTALNRQQMTSEVQRKIDELDQLIAQNEMKREVVIRSPVAGTVAAVLVNPGQDARLGQTTLSLLPDGSVLQVQLLVPSHSIGFMEPNDAVLLRFDAFPYQRFGQQRARVVSISRTALTAEEAALLRGAPTTTEKQERLFKVVVALQSGSLRSFGRDFQLRPGMSVEADVLLESHRLIEWMLLPAKALGKRLVGASSDGS